MIKKIKYNMQDSSDAQQVSIVKEKVTFRNSSDLLRDSIYNIMDIEKI